MSSYVLGRWAENDRARLPALEAMDTMLELPGNFILRDKLCLVYDPLLRRCVCAGRRWAENDRARLSALEGMKAMLETRLEKISELTATPTSQLKFLSDAWAQVRDSGT